MSYQKIIDGSKISTNILHKLKELIVKFDLNLKLTVILIGNNSASLSYVKMKASDAKKIGIKVNIVHKDEKTTQYEIEKLIIQNNSDKKVHGILMQLPVPSHLDSNYLLNLISPSKDVDGLSYINIGKLYSQNIGLKPCTPLGCLYLLKTYNIPIEGKKAVVIGRSNLVGRPMAALLEQQNATVTICHSRTKNLKKICLDADIIISATGSQNLVTKDMVTSKTTVIDVGINFIGGKLFGDVDFPNVEPIVKYISPVPGGVGPMTRAMLMRNIIYAFALQMNHELLNHSLFQDPNP